MKEDAELFVFLVLNVVDCVCEREREIEHKNLIDSGSIKFNVNVHSFRMANLTM